MEQKKLIFREPQTEVSDKVILAQPDFKSALKLGKATAGLNDDQISRELEIDPAQLSRIWSNSAYFPENKIIPFMEFCQNNIPLKWLAMMRGFALVRLRLPVEIELEEAYKTIQQQQVELEAIKKFFKDTNK